MMFFLALPRIILQASFFGTEVGTQINQKLTVYQKKPSLLKSVYQKPTFKVYKNTGEQHAKSSNTLIKHPMQAC